MAASSNVIAIYTLVLALLVALLPRLASAHSWNEQLAVISPNGNFTGPYGYPRGYVERTSPGFNDEMMTYLLPPDSAGRTRIDNSDLVCAPTQQTYNQTAGFPRLQVSPGSRIAMKYLENGHVTLPQNQLGKPPSAGTVFVFGTSQPNPSETLLDVLQWTADGSGGDKRGVLLTAQNFDDGRCHQINSGAMSLQRQQEYPDPDPGQPGTVNELWCETDVQVPTAGLTPGTVYTIYWVWSWPTAPGGVDPTYPDGKDELYTTCSDLEVLANVPAAAPVSNTLVQQDPMPSADAAFASRTAINPNPTFGAAAVGSPTPVAVGSTSSDSTTTLTTTITTTATTTLHPAATPSPSATTMTLGQPLAAVTNIPAAPAAAVSASSSSSSSSSPPPVGAVLKSVFPGASPAPTTTTAAAAAAVPAAVVSSSSFNSSADAGSGTVVTATVYVTATLLPGEPTLIVRGEHVVTFIAPGAAASSSSLGAAVGGGVKVKARADADARARRWAA